MNRESLLAGVLLAAPLLAQPAKFQEHVVATGPRAGGYQVVIADVNHDGKPDLIALASGLRELDWYENPGWQKHVIVDGIRQPINLAMVGPDTIALAHDFSPNAKRSIGTVSILERTGDNMEADGYRQGAVIAPATDVERDAGERSADE